jgi:hypothetical protein
MDKRDKRLGGLLRSLEAAPPPEGLKARLYEDLRENVLPPDMNAVQRLLYTHPLRAAGVLSVVISGLLWAILGNHYPALVNALLFAR